MLKIKSKNCIKFFIAFALSIFAAVLFLSLSEVYAQAKTYYISTPEQLANINWVSQGYGPGNTYIINNDFTLSDSQDGVCRLTKGTFVIDFNGHTVQTSSANMAAFQIRGANVVMKDSKVSNNKESVRSYGIGAIEINAGTLEIQSGNYCGYGSGGDSSALFVGGGVCVVNGGYFGGYTFGAVTAGTESVAAKLFINSGTFQAGYLFAVEDMGYSNIKISKGSFVAGSKGHAFGALTLGNYYNFNSWLATDSSFSSDFETVYWNLNSTYSYTPGSLAPYAIAYNTPNISITSTTNKKVGTEYLPKTASSARPAKTTLGKLKSKKKRTLTVKWAKKSGVTGYEIQIARNKNFTKGLKTVKVNNANKTSRTFKKLKSKKRYYVRIRTLKGNNHSGWSKVKKIKIK